MSLDLFACTLDPGAWPVKRPAASGRQSRKSSGLYSRLPKRYEHRRDSCAPRPCQLCGHKGLITLHSAMRERTQSCSGGLASLLPASNLLRHPRPKEMNSSYVRAFPPTIVSICALELLMTEGNCHACGSNVV